MADYLTVSHVSQLSCLDISLNHLPAEPTAQASAPVPSKAGAGTLPLTAALLDVSSRGLSFATPGHRGGRSWGGGV